MKTPEQEKMIQVISKILEYCGFTNIDLDVKTEKAGIIYDLDICFKYEDTTYSAHVRDSRTANANPVLAEMWAVMVAGATRRCQPSSIPMLIVLACVSDELRDRIQTIEAYDINRKLVLIDIRNLLYMVQNNAELREELISILPFSTAQITPIKPEIVFLEAPPRVDSNIHAGLIRRLENWDPENESSSAYETLCTNVLQALFMDDLDRWEKQKPSNGGLFRFDLICKIKNDTTKEFWKVAGQFFNTKYIVFEYKNYSGLITQKEIFTTERYLYLQALRGVAIIISTKGIDANGQKAVKGVLRENGKLIIVLTNDDLLQMLQQKAEGKDPADYLSEKLDTLLIDLEK